MFPIYSFTLKAAINEIRNISPDVSSAFIFKKDGEIIAQDDTINQETIKSVIEVFNEMNQRMDAVGGLENLTIQGSNNHVCFTPCINDLYLVTVSSKLADEKIVYALTRVLVPTLVKLLNQVTENGETSSNQTIEPPATLIDTEPYLPKPPVHQLMIEKIGGLLAPSDTVRIDSEVLASWNSLYEGKTIDKVNIETLKLKTTQCKFKAIKETKNPTKGIIQIPEKILLTLEASKGELVMVKPIIN